MRASGAPGDPGYTSDLDLDLMSMTHLACVPQERQAILAQVLPDTPVGSRAGGGHEGFPLRDGAASGLRCCVVPLLPGRPLVALAGGREEKVLRRWVDGVHRTSLGSLAVSCNGQYVGCP